MTDQNKQKPQNPNMGIKHDTQKPGQQPMKSPGVGRERDLDDKDDDEMTGDTAKTPSPRR